ncbi:MAG: hypothetical protein J7L47_02785 [Candidatus Odinarchaeota archaeon]|nr:hypothetical protein [Candidatus Odinarchaeota archaeon]
MKTMLKRREIKQIQQLLPLVAILVTLILIGQIIPFTPFANNKYHYNERGYHTRYLYQQRIITLNFDDEFYIETYPSQLFLPQHMQRAFTISIVLNTVSELQQLISRGYFVANYTVRTLAYTITVDMGGYLVTNQFAKVITYINNEQIHETTLKTSTTEPIHLAPGKSVRGSFLNITFFMKLGISGGSAGANMKVKQVSTTLKINLVKDLKNNDSSNTSGDTSGDNESGDSGSHDYITTKPIPPPIKGRVFIISWLDTVQYVFIDTGIIFTILILLGVIICLHLLIRQSKKTRH